MSNTRTDLPWLIQLGQNKEGYAAISKSIEEGFLFGSGFIDTATEGSIKHIPRENVTIIEE